MIRNTQERRELVALFEALTIEKNDFEQDMLYLKSKRWRYKIFWVSYKKL